MKGVVSLALAAMAVLVAAAPADASFPGNNGPIALVQPNATGATIGLVNADGTGFRFGFVAVGPADLDPAWSPDGRRLAFTSTRDGNEEVYVLDFTTGAQTRLTSDPARDHDPTWSPDGQEIAFASERDGNSEIYVMPAAGGPPRRLTDDPGEDRQPTWSVSGTIAFASNRTGDYDLYAMDAQGGGLRRLTQDPGADLDPSWSPDGTQLAYAHDGGTGDFDVDAEGADGQNQRALTVPAAGNDRFPAWSPDGTRIAFTSGNGEFAQIKVMSAAGSASGVAPQRIAGGTDANWAPLPPPAGGPDEGRTVTVTPAGARVLAAPATTQAPSTDPLLQAQVRSPVELPVGTTIDASLGRVELDAVTTTPEGPGNVGHATVTGGVFTVTQGATAGAEPTLSLLPSRPLCTRRARAARVPYPEGYMRIRVRGHFRTVSGYGRASGRGTEWIMRDRCDGTTFKVLEGLVLVTDSRRHRTIRVPAGRCYLAAVRLRRDALRPRRACPAIKPPR